MDIQHSTDYQQKSPWVLEDQYLSHNYLLLVSTGVGCIMNFALLYRFYLNRYYLQSAHMSLVNILLGTFVHDFGEVIIFSIHNVKRDLPWFWCQASGFFACIIGASALSVSVMGVERYFQIILQKTFTKKRMLFILAFCWMFPLFLSSFPIISGTYHIPQSSRAVCLPDFTGRTLPHFIISISSVVAIVLVIGVNSLSYYFIYQKAIVDGFKWSTTTVRTLFVGQSTDDTHQGASGSITSGKRSKTSAQKEQMKLTIKLAAITLSFCVAWIGAGISFAYQAISGNRPSAAIDITCIALTSLFSVVNPIMVLTIDKRYRWDIRTPVLNYLCRKKIAKNF